MDLLHNYAISVLSGHNLKHDFIFFGLNEGYPLRWFTVLLPLLSGFTQSKSIRVYLTREKKYGGICIVRQEMNNTALSSDCRRVVSGRTS